MLAKAKKHIIAVLLVSILIYISLAIFSDLQDVEEVIKSLSFQIIPILILFSILTQVIRAVRWHYYLRELKIKISFIDSVIIFMASLFMGFTPGKLGEGIKSYFLKKQFGISNSRTLPIVIIERLSDILGLVLLSSLGTLYFSWGKYIVVISFILMAIILVLLSNRKIKDSLITWASNIRYLKKYTENLTASSKSVDACVGFKPMIVSTLLSSSAWIFEFLIFYLVLTDFSQTIDFIGSSFAYSISILAGSISMLPAGLGVTESSLSYFLIKNGISSDVSIASTILIRIFTLWFTILIGFLFLVILKRKFYKINLPD